MNNKFEYKILERAVNFGADPSPDDELDLIIKEDPIDIVLNKLGMESWELICIKSEYNKDIYYFKKEKMW